MQFTYTIYSTIHVTIWRKNEKCVSEMKNIAIDFVLHNF